MAFDPDAFLAEEMTAESPQPEIFNPDAFLAEDQLPKGNILDAIIEPVQAIAGGAIGDVAGGLKGAGTAMLQGAEKGAETVKETQQGFQDWNAPETQAGQESLEKIGKITNWLGEQMRIPASGVFGLGEFLFSGGDIDSAVNIIDDIQERGIGPVIGDKVFESTGSPLLASAAFLSPDAVLTAFGGKLAQSGISDPLQARQTRLQTQLASDIVSQPEAQTTASQMVVADGDRLPVPRPEQGQISLPEGVLDIDQFERVNSERMRRDAAQNIQQRITDGTAKIKLDPLAQKAIDLGWDPGIIASVKAASPDDWRAMQKALDKYKEAKEVSRAGIENRPSDVAGDTLQQRVLYLDGVKNRAGQRIGELTETLKDVPVNMNEAVRGFGQKLMESGVEFNPQNGRFNISFEGSDIEFSPGAKRVIKNLFKRMEQGTPIDAYEAHRFKKLIDEQVDYGKSIPGYAGAADRTIKQFRRDINKAIGEASPEYKQQNEVFSEAITALDSLQSSVGKRVDLTGEKGKTQLGQELRKIMSNYNTRADIYTSANEVGRLANKHGGGFIDDPSTQILFVDEMARAIGTPAERRTFESLVARGTQRGLESAVGGSGLISDLLAPIADKFGEWRGRSPEGRVKAMEDLLSSLKSSTGGQ